MGKPVFPVMFWYPPANTYENWKLAAECGFTVVPFRAGSLKEGRQVLDWLQELGILGMVEDRRISPRMVDNPGWGQTIAQVVADYGAHPALWGYFMADEPTFAGLDRLAALTNAFHQADPHHIAYSNLLSSGCSTNHIGVVDYKTYVKAYIDRVKPQMLSYDIYTLHEGYDNPEYFHALEVTREAALEAGLPFMNIYLSVPHFAYRDPSPEDLRYEVYTSLAYGARALTYFTYATPDIENYHEAVVDIYGNPTPKFPYVRQLNQELQKLGPWLLGLSTISVTHVGGCSDRYAQHVGAEPICEASGAGCDLLMGEFTDSDNLPWVLVVNKDRQHSAWVTCKIRSRLTRIDEVARSTGKLRLIARDSGARAALSYEDGLVVRFWLAPADGRLMRLCNQ